ncbi:MAG: carboxypeptidase-like regulatory domain-containing protein, partial [Bacteroidia bacterium]
MKKILLLIGILVALAGTQVDAQTKYTLSGRITDDAGEALGGGSVMLLQAADSILQGFAITDGDGAFKFQDVPAGKYVFKAVFLKHKTLVKQVDASGANSTIDMGSLKLIPESANIEGVEITEERIPVRIKGDTIEYDAKAFTVQPNDAVEELFKKLPGVEVDRDGNIKAQGETVTKILVDGKEFFGDDPKVASKNLPAESVDKVQVFDKMSDVSEFTGVDDGSRTRTINLTLKDDYKTGYFGNVSGGYGTKNRFEGKANLNRFGEKSQISFLGQANNTNQQGFSMQDYTSFVGGIGNLMRSSDGGQQMDASELGLNLSSDPSIGFFTTGAAGLNGNFTPNKNTQITASYFYNYLQKDIERKLFKETILDENSFTTTQNGTQQDQNQNHRASIYWKQEIDSLTRLSVRVAAKL